MKKKKEKSINKARHPRQGSQQQQAGSSQPPPQLSQSPKSSRRSSTDSSFSGCSSDRESVASFDSDWFDKPLSEAPPLGIQEQKEAENAEFLRLYNSGRLRPESLTTEGLEQLSEEPLIDRQVAQFKKEQRREQRQQLIQRLQPIEMMLNVLLQQPPEQLQQQLPLIQLLQQQLQQLQQEIQQLQQQNTQQNG